MWWVIDTLFTYFAICTDSVKSTDVGTSGRIMAALVVRLCRRGYFCYENFVLERRDPGWMCESQLPTSYGQAIAPIRMIDKYASWLLSNLDDRQYETLPTDNVMNKE